MVTEVENEKFSMQDSQYLFPYHYIPFFDRRGSARRYRTFGWTYEYLCYLKHVTEIINELKPKSILDAGCGDGRLFSLLEVDVDRCVGVDLSEKAIRFARAFNPKAEFLVKDIKDIDETFEVVTAIEVIEHIPDDKVMSFIKAMEEKTKPEGHVIISVPTKVVPVLKKHYRHYDIELFNQQLEASGANLSIVSVDYVYRLSWFIDLYYKLTENLLWTLDIKIMNLVIWKLLWRYCRYADTKDGKHLVVVLKKG